MSLMIINNNANNTNKENLDDNCMLMFLIITNDTGANDFARQIC